MTSFEQFSARYPEYALTSALDDLRAAEYGRLDAQDQVYLDYTGAGLHAASQIRQHAGLLSEQILGNPHSASPSSTEATISWSAAWEISGLIRWARSTFL